MTSNEINGQDMEIEEVTAVEMLSGSDTLMAVDRAQIDMQIATAKQYPRSVDKALKEALTLATMDEETAASCLYALPRSGRTIEGPSARLAEIIASSWGNLRADADIVAEDQTHITAMGTCMDLEKNVAFRVRVSRRITDRHGKRYNEDMIGVTKNAAISIALRNAVFKVVPKAHWNRIYKEARKASLGRGGTITQKRQNALDWFGKLGVQPEQIFEQLNVRGLDDIGEDELIVLRGMRTAIQEGDSTVEDMFRPARHSEGTDDLNEALRADADGKPTDDAPGGPSARFGDLCDANGWTPQEAKRTLALERYGDTDLRRLKNDDYEWALGNIGAVEKLMDKRADSADGLTKPGSDDDELPI